MNRDRLTRTTDPRLAAVASVRHARMSPEERFDTVGTLNARWRALAWLSVPRGLSEEEHCYQYLHTLYGDELGESFLRGCSAGFYKAQRATESALRAHARHPD